MCFHCERNEVCLLIQIKSLRGILRAKPALRMTIFRSFPQPPRRRLVPGLTIAQARDDVIDGDGADWVAAGVYHGQAVQIVFVEQLEYFLVLGVRQDG